MLCFRMGGPHTAPIPRIFGSHVRSARLLVSLRLLSFKQDGEIGVIGTAGCSLDLSRMEKSSHTEDILLSPAPYEHWTIMECLQQPEAIARALAFGGTTPLTDTAEKIASTTDYARRNGPHVSSFVFLAFDSSCVDPHDH